MSPMSSMNHLRGRYWLPLTIIVVATVAAAAPQLPVSASAEAPAVEAFFERCPQGPDWVKFRGSCYRHFEASQQYWYLAQLDCENWGGNLVSIATAIENSFVGKLTYCQSAWIGRYAVHVDHMASSDNYRWTDGTGSQYHAHDFVSARLHYPLISARNLSWENNVYHAKQSYVCEVQTPNKTYTCDCPSGWKQLDRHCFLMPHFEATYIEADFFCRGQDAHVASLSNAAELRAMSLLNVDSLGCPVDTWIGLLKLNPCRIDFSTGSKICYRWSDRSGDYKAFPAWQAGSPNEDRVTNCVALQDRHIKTIPCHTRARFVCKKPVEPNKSRQCTV